MNIFDGVRECQLTQDMVPAEGIVDFVYPLMGSVLKGIQLGAVRCAGVGDDYHAIDRVPPLTHAEIDALMDATGRLSMDCEYQIDSMLAAMAWVQASLLDDGSQAYKRLTEQLDNDSRTLARQRMALQGVIS